MSEPNPTASQNSIRMCSLVTREIFMLCAGMDDPPPTPTVIGTVLTQIRSELDAHNADKAVRDSLENLSGFSSRCVTLYMTQEQAETVSFPRKISQASSEVICVKDTMPDGCIQHNRRIAAVQQLAYAHAALAADQSDDMGSDGPDRAISAYSRHKLPRIMDDLDVDHQQQQAILKGIYCSDIARLSKALKL